jgi:hypothetical protein
MLIPPAHEALLVALASGNHNLNSLIIQRQKPCQYRRRLASQSAINFDLSEKLSVPPSSA